MRLILSLILTLLCGFSAVAQDFIGTVTWVYDGDSFKMEADGKTVQVRIFGIDAPEKDQNYADEARQALIDLIKGKTVSVVQNNIDKHERVVGIVTCDGVNINAKMISAGWAWWSRNFAPKNTTFANAEDAARKDRLGLWQDSSPIAPWEWRTATKQAKKAGR